MTGKAGRSGRPSVFRPEMTDLAGRYAEQYHEEGDTVPMLPLLLRFMRKHGVHLKGTTLDEWRRTRDDERWPERAEFLDHVDTMMDEQHAQLATGALDRSLEPNTSRLMLTCNHGYVDRRRYEGADGGPMLFQLISGDENL